MRLRSRRRDVVVWIQSARAAGEYSSVKVTRPGRYQPIRRCIRLGALLTVVGLVRLIRAARARWRPLLAGGVLTAAGVMLRGGAGGIVLIPGLMFLAYAPLMETGSDEERKRRSVLRRDLPGTQPRPTGAILKRRLTGIRTAPPTRYVTSSPV